ncbi:hypothetical protein ABVK25_005703 [Lepraria finkii]|uniref:Uncharacterized protein n=1 Tax=Lepraria finkii TaxID=1340010 RepID=A0ABR4B8J0_9LECA
MPRSIAPLALLANEILDQIFEALCPAGFFSSPDWTVDFVAEREERGYKKKEREQLEEEERRRFEESEMDEGVEDGEEEQPKDESDSSEAITPEYYESEPGHVSPKRIQLSSISGQPICHSSDIARESCANMLG